MRVKRDGKALVLRNDYTSYKMADILPRPDYKVVLPKGQFNGLCAHYNIRTDPDLGLGWAQRVALQHLLHVLNFGKCSVVGIYIHSA